MRGLDSRAQQLLARVALARHQADRGATATEYAILVGFIAVAIVLGVTVFGETVNGWYNAMSKKLP